MKAIAHCIVDVEVSCFSSYHLDEISKQHHSLPRTELKSTQSYMSDAALQVIGGDPDKDVAVLQLQCPPEKFKDLKPVELGTSANLLVGQKVFAIGNPFG